jgi:hypothetical protein
MPYSETGTIGGTAPGASSCWATSRSTRSCAPRRSPARSRSSAGAAIARGRTPAGHRQVPFSVTVDGDDIGPLAPHVTGGSFLNFLKDTSRTRDAYTTADLARLLEPKRAYDPDDLFGVGHGIGQASAACATRYRAAA